MIRFSKSVLAVGGVVVAAGLIGFTNPKTVHALAAALVQVTNTASNPVVNSEVTLSAAQIVEVYCSGEFDGTCNQILLGGQISTDQYSVPAGKMLVITDVDINARTGSSTANGGVIEYPSGEGFGGYAPLEYSVPEDGATHHFSMQRGVVFPANFGLAPYASGVGYTSEYLYGYLTSN